MVIHICIDIEEIFTFSAGQAGVLPSADFCHNTPIIDRPRAENGCRETCHGANRWIATTHLI
ncbi:hypothetical protein HMPREF0454_04254 [Hafnia alvei ATCC 51873]|uniref:Uncharacterized protein n=1 Tax=Hafnia alvei ATCC 51873 TaxID=1002364 RepID=G9YCC1_HAFAL|nr:hypothetical protein F652_525 [Enterobacteriaceae bacterium bta3-1]EHM38734.1 hypothetical protein HMPREF0454_04254 [Hafnia alvei ATCC 51873]